MPSKSMTISLEKLSKLLPKDIKVTQLYIHTKLKQEIVETTFIDGSFKFHTFVPYIDINKGVNNNTEEQVANYLRSIKHYFAKEAIKKWKTEQKKEWETKYKNRGETKPFFDKLLSLKLEEETFGNPNYASRLRDIRKLGYTLTAIHNPQTGNYARIMLPLPTYIESKYETVPKSVTQTLARLKRYIEAYSGERMNEKFLLADHKFPESRWDENTPKENSANMTDEEILQKFQLLDNASNLRKKQMCESCAGSGERPSIYGLTFFYKGKIKWDKKIPTRGKDAEKGCIGCPWYDIEEWKKQFNKRFKKEFE